MEELDGSDEVNVYAKLPKGFSIPTPVGHYSPDWAIVFHEGSVRHIYFVAETKGTMDSLNLRPIEKAKIDCAKKLFATISTGMVSALIEDANFEYLMYLIGKRFEYSLPQSRVQPIVKMEQGKCHLKNAKAYHESLSKNEVDIHIDGGHLIAQKKNLLDSLINSALVDRMHEMAMNYEQIKGVNHRG